MVWGAINAGFHSDLVILNRTLTARRYIDEALNFVLLDQLAKPTFRSRYAHTRSRNRVHSRIYCASTASPTSASESELEFST